MDRPLEIKRFLKNILVFACLTTCVLNSDAQNPQDSISNLLYGAWFLNPEIPQTADTLTFRRVSFYQMDFGPQIQIMQDGTFNDININSHKGSWKFSAQSMQLETTVAINRRFGKKFRVVSVDADNLILLKIY